MNPSAFKIIRINEHAVSQQTVVVKKNKDVKNFLEKFPMFQIEFFYREADRNFIILVDYGQNKRYEMYTREHINRMNSAAVNKSTLECFDSYRLDGVSKEYVKIESLKEVFDNVSNKVRAKIDKLYPNIWDLLHV